MTDLSTVKGRVKYFARYMGLTIIEFETACGLGRGYVGAMRKGLGPEKLQQVLNAFPDLNRDWLLYGEGEMLKSSGNIMQSVAQKNIIGSINNTMTTADKVMLEELQVRRRQVDELIAIIRDMQKKKK